MWGQTEEDLAASLAAFIAIVLSVILSMAFVILKVLGVLTLSWLWGLAVFPLSFLIACAVCVILL
jgi:hypothetical protein